MVAARLEDNGSVADLQRRLLEAADKVPELTERALLA
ncbi:unnamed protein product, partial [marine sediment metagenome]